MMPVLVTLGVPRVQRSSAGGWRCGAWRVPDPRNQGQTVPLDLGCLWDGCGILAEPCRHDTREEARSCPAGYDARQVMRRRLKGRGNRKRGKS